MIITINNIPLSEWYIKEIKLPIKLPNKIIKNKQNKIDKLDICTKMLFATGAISTGDFYGLEIIIKLFQEFAYYIGMGYATWGAIEYAMDNPAGVEKTKRAIIGFIGVYIIPILFKSIKNALG